MSLTGALPSIRTPLSVTPSNRALLVGAAATTGLVGISTVVVTGWPPGSQATRPSTQWFWYSVATLGLAAPSNASWVAVTLTFPSSS